MKRINFFLTMLLATMIALPSVALAQDYTDDVYVIEETKPIPANETKKERKERIKRGHDIVDSVFHLKAARAAYDQFFVLQATQVNNGRGFYELGLNDNTNFLLMQGDKGIFQVAFNNMDAGMNGLGGVTLHGNIRNVNVKDDKKGNTIMTYSMIGRNMNASVSITIYSGSDQAVADIYPTLGYGRISLRGRLVPYRNDDISINP